ncbi:MAG: LOG family protein [Thainema sp.]
MVSSPNSLTALEAEVSQLIRDLPTMKHREFIQQALLTLVRLAESEADRLDWKILNYSLQDMAQAFEMFYPYRHVRKITIFGSARTPADHPEYQMALEFARQVTKQGFMVMTGAGGGIMQAGNMGAGAGNSFGLNIQLPFEQGANPFIHGDQKLLFFKYFFTRKLFFLRESDALALFPGGFGTQDEAFECLTLIQTGKSGLVPLVMVDQPGGDYWKSWDVYIRQHLLDKGLISVDDPSLYVITDSLDEACQAIADFYRVYHSSRYVGERFVMRLNCELSDEAIHQLNEEYSDILVKGKIEKSKALPQEVGDETEEMPRLVMYFNQRDYGRLHQFIMGLNRFSDSRPETTHPEHK